VDDSALTHLEEIVELHDLVNILRAATSPTRQVATAA
jgi:hypothetical protein